MSSEPLPQGMLRDGTGRRFLVEHAGVWDSSPRGDRVTVYYEDEIRPDDAPPLYRLTPDPSLDWQDETADHPPWLRRIIRVLIAAADAWRGARRDWREGAAW
jgi:hypothetical protein